MQSNLQVYYLRNVLGQDPCAFSVPISEGGMYAICDVQFLLVKVGVRLVLQSSIMNIFIGSRLWSHVGGVLCSEVAARHSPDLVVVVLK